ncbi:MAG: type I glutamate--ammonia ligase [Chloroflexi bacterium]|nr:type I glutamate--ammonia ligase [Chloroflexota bacterium]
MPSKLSPAAQDVMDKALEDNVKFVSLQFTDVVGSIKNVVIPVSGLAEVLEKGIWFDGSSIEGFSRIHESDMFLQVEPASYRVVPWTKNGRATARLLCDVFRTSGEVFGGDPRRVLKNAVDGLMKEFGLTFHTSTECEFFLFAGEGHNSTKPVPHDVVGYWDYSPRDLAAEVRQEVMEALTDLGMVVERAHHEVAVGQHEINIRYDEAMSTADNTLMLKATIKAIAAKNGLVATFMPKPIAGINGSGMHTHQSLFDAKGDNVFYDAKDEYKLSPMAYSFIAGQIAHARALAAVINPTVNSYKRLVPGYEAPVYLCWGQINRSALIRIPHYSPGREKSTRLELRCPDSSSNPYLAAAAMLAAGLDGVRRGLKAPDPIEESAYEFTDEQLAEKGIRTLPTSLDEALDELSRDEVVKTALGGAYNAFVRAKRAECQAYRMQVTPWELEEYMEKI